MRVAPGNHQRPPCLAAANRTSVMLGPLFTSGMVERFRCCFFRGKSFLLVNNVRYSPLSLCAEGPISAQLTSGATWRIGADPGGPRSIVVDPPHWPWEAGHHQAPMPPKSKVSANGFTSSPPVHARAHITGNWRCRRHRYGCRHRYRRRVCFRNHRHAVSPWVLVDACLHA